MAGSTLSTQWWHVHSTGKIICDLCPRSCLLHSGQHGACYIRQNLAGRMSSLAWGHASGLTIDPIEKKPLYHFYPGSPILSFGTLGCNLQCKFCQNWEMAHPHNRQLLQNTVSPQGIAASAVAQHCPAVAFTYNDPVVFAELAIATAQCCQALGLHTVAVTAGYISPVPRAAFFASMDAANVDLKSFNPDFYRRFCGAELAPVLDTLLWLRHESQVWLEITTLLIPDCNDSPQELQALSQWLVSELGAETPLHFTAFHPDYKLQGLPPTSLGTLHLARQIAMDAGIKHVYLGNVHDPASNASYCAQCGARLIERQGYRLEAYRLDAEGKCPHCGHPLAGRFTPTTIS